MEKKAINFRPRDKFLELGVHTRVMAVVNVTPDSFWDGRRFLEPAAAADHALALVEAGADIVDLGGESTRPGARPVSAAEELDRVLPALEALRKRCAALISVDTYKSQVAEAVLRSGADIINDVSAFRFDPNMPAVVSRWGAGVVLMHLRGEPATMHQLPPSPDILVEIKSDLKNALQVSYKHQIRSDRILLDPGIGFGKTAEENLQILNRLSFLNLFQLPILVGTSRKSFLGKILKAPAEDRIFGTAASVAIAILRGAHVIRVHDVKEMRQVAEVSDAILSERLL